ncbi:MAG: DNA polymerase Y family protein [Pseudomonadota bacterium]
MMRRFLSVWLPRWPIERRFRRTAAIWVKDGLAPFDAEPVVLAAASQRGPRVTAATTAAERLGICVGMPLADARALYPSLMVAAADPQGDLAALSRLALWHQRYSPYARMDAPDGIAVDITGCAHLFGGEKAMLAELADRLDRFGLTARLAIGPTIGAAWAYARYGASAQAIIAHEALCDHLAALPVSALRLEEDTVAALSRLGLKRIGDLLGKPRAPLAARFGSELILRLDQAFGWQSEVFSPLSQPPSYHATCRFVEPLITAPSIELAVHRLAETLTVKLTSAGKGARKLSLSLFRLDGWVETLDIQTSALALSHDADHLTRLFGERLERIESLAGFGFEAATLGAFFVEDLIPHQPVLKNGEERKEGSDDLARLIDRLAIRFGAENVVRYAPAMSYLPEGSARSFPALQGAERCDWPRHARALQGGEHFGRPLLLFAAPESVTTLAEVPDGPPVKFEWRRISHRVMRTDGPERIAPEWWRRSGAKSRKTRDYYRVEDEAGRRFWLYREGLHERGGDQPRWFIHGMFA